MTDSTIVDRRSTARTRRLPRRLPTDEDMAAHRPVQVVWELTLACNLRCVHCGSRAGRKREDELSTEECLDVVRQLAELGTRADHPDRRRSLLAQGLADHRQGDHRRRHPLRHPDRRARAHRGAHPRRGRGRHRHPRRVDRRTARHSRPAARRQGQLRSRAARAALRQRGRDQARREHADQCAVETASARDLRYHRRARRAATGRCRSRWRWAMRSTTTPCCCSPTKSPRRSTLLADLFERGRQIGFRLIPGNNIGYFGPHEYMWRTITSEPEHWAGCTAGENSLGLEADGKIKSCPSLPADPYGGGNARTVSIRDAMAALVPTTTRLDRTPAGGFCGSCYYWNVCRGGCTWVTHGLSGKRGDNPFCHYRARELAKKGLRERIVKVAEAPGEPFDFGRFDIVVEDENGGAFRANLRATTRSARADASSSSAPAAANSSSRPNASARIAARRIGRSASPPSASSSRRCSRSSMRSTRMRGAFTNLSTDRRCRPARGPHSPANSRRKAWRPTFVPTMPRSAMR